MLQEIQSYFPLYYKRTAWSVLGVAMIGYIALLIEGHRLAPSWGLLAVGLIIYFVIGHAIAFLANYVRAKFSKTQPTDVAQPVIYYTAGMPAASYQSPFLQPSTLVKLALFAAAIYAANAAFFFVQARSQLIWRSLDGMLFVAAELGFALGCWEIDRAIKASRSSPDP